MACSYPNRWTLHCRKCKAFIASDNILILGVVPPSQHHLAVRPGKEKDVQDYVRKVERIEENDKRAIMSKYKLLCQNCDAKVGGEELIEGNETLCFKAEAIFIRDRYGREFKENKLKKLVPELKTRGIEEMNLAAVQKKNPSFVMKRQPPTPLVYCDVPKMSREEINSLTLHNPREYQTELFRWVMHGNSLVFLPTGSGKTLIAAMAISCMKMLNPGKLAVFIVDRIPLAHQQGDYIKKQVPALKVGILSGDTGSSEANKSNFERTMKGLAENKIDVLVLTHQLFLNFLADPNGAVCMTDVCVLVIDEAHRCQGNHVFRQIIRDYYVKVSPDKYKPLIVALTASPAGEATLDGTLKNLSGLLDRLCCCARMPVTSQDLGVYVNKPVACPKVIPLSQLQQCLEDVVVSYLKTIDLRLLKHAPSYGTITGMSPLAPNYKGALRQIILKCHEEEKTEGHALGEMAMHFVGVLELNNVLGFKVAMECLQECFELIDNASTPMESQKKELVCNDYDFVLFRSQIESLSSCQEVDHGKFPLLVKELKSFAEQCQSDTSSRGIVFVNMRKTAYKFCQRLLQLHPDISKTLNPKPFVGHGDGGDGMAWHGEQELTLRQFRSGGTKLLISTNVLEEGLDVPICNLVIRFDTSPSLRSFVQSRGRASRRPGSKFVVLYTDPKKHEEAALVEEKEKNMEVAMRILHNTSFASVSQANKFACEARKPDIPDLSKPPEHVPPQETAPVQYSEVKIPCVQVVTHTIRSRTTREMPPIISFFNRQFDVKTMEPIETKMSYMRSEEDAECLSKGANLFELELPHGESPLSFMEGVTKSWCSRPVGPNIVNSQAWLEPLDTGKRKRNDEVDVLSAETLFIGYFRHPTSFCQHWPGPLEAAPPRNIRLVFQHDLKTLSIFFTVNENGQMNLYEVEIPYTQLASFIIADRKEKYANLFLSLNTSPRLYVVEEGGLMWEEIIQDKESGYYSGEESDTEESSGDEGYQVDLGDVEKPNVEYDADADADAADDDDDDDDRPPDENIIHTAATVEESGGTTFSHPILQALSVIKEWYRVPSVANSQDAFGQCPSYLLKVSNTDLDEVYSGLKSCGKDLFFARVDTNQRSLLRPTEVYLPPRLDEDIRYAVQCLFAYHPVVLGRIDTINFGLLLASKPKNTVLAALDKLSKVLDEDVFCQPEQTLEKILEDPNLRCFRFTPQSIPGHCALVKRLIITPTRLLFSPEEIIQNNRVLRNYTPKNFICANIRDEDYSRISSSNSDLSRVLVRIKNVLDEGVDICGERYLFLGCSNSQLRNHSCWFVKASTNPAAIRAWMGDFSSIRCVGTYVSRMGQCFSTSLDTVGISIDDGVHWTDRNDVVTEDKKYTFSDGVGGISQELAKEVLKKIGKKFRPSTFQIRFAGYKGVLAVDSQLPGKEAYFRPSMRKFYSAHRRLEVIQTSRPQAVFLNHQVIMLLSNLGVPEEVFQQLMREALDNLAGMLLDERRAVQQMSSAVKIGIEYRSLSAAGIPLTVEPFFRCVIAAVYYDSLQSLLTKARIKLPTDKARLMMGVMDETGTLKYGQVFVQYSAVSTDPKSNEEFDFTKKIVHEGPVMVTRNPCLHPGDVRKLVAVDVPQLRHLVDCVVFPSVGPRPHPSEMAGGDLDGDLYFVSWHKDLFSHPDKDLFPPMDYSAPPKQLSPFDITPADMTRFIIDYIRSDQLGVIDNAHKAHADRQAQGVESEKCLLLAEAHSLAVDAPKTGVWPNIKSLDLHLDQYPDFMMKTDKPSYKSNKLLGKLYRACRAFKRNAEQSLPTDIQRPVIDGAFVVQGYKKYIEKARELYLEYSENLDRLMTIYGINTEAELVSGCFRKLHKRLSKERTEVAEIVSKLVGDVRVKFRKQFFEEFKMDTSRHKLEKLQSIQIHQKASAWYHVAYAEAPSPPRGGAKATRFLSFPWVVDDVMASIREHKKTGLACNFSVAQQGAIPRGLAQDVSEFHFKGPKVDDISRDLMKRLQDDKDMLLQQYKRRLSGKNLVRQHIQNKYKGLNVAAFGSTATLLFREDSDVDLVVYETARKKHRSFNKKEQLKLLKSLTPLMAKMFKNTRLVGKAKVPVILCKNFKKTQAPSLSLDVPFDLSPSRDGLDKAIVVSYYIMSEPVLLPILRFLLLWGHKSGLTGHGKRICVNTNALVFIFLSHCLSNGCLNELGRDVVNYFYERNREGNFVDQLQDWENILEGLVGSSSVGKKPPNLQGFSPGELLIEFLASHTSLERLTIPDSISRLVNAKCVQDLLKSCPISFLQEQMQRAYHLLAVHGDLETLLNLCEAEVRETIHLSTGLSAAMKGAEKENAREIQERTGARVSIRRKFQSFIYRLIVEARGTELQVEAVEHLIQNMTRTTSAMRAAFMSMCFVKGASQILFEGYRGDDDVVTLVPYHSSHHPQHDGTRLFTPMLATPMRFNPEGNLSLEGKEFAEFRQKFLTQFALASKEHEVALHGEMEFAVRFGRIYIFRVPKSFIEDAESVTVQMLQANLKRGYKAKPTATGKPKRELVVTNSGVTRRNARRTRQKRQKPKEKKKEKKMQEKPCRSSYFTIIKSKEQAERFLREKGFIEVGCFEVYDVNTKGNEELNVKFDGELNFTELCFSPLRWYLTDVKRRWKRSRNKKTQDGDESDVRFILQSRRSLNQEEIRDTEYEVYLELMQQPNQVVHTTKPTKKQKLMFCIKEDLWNEVSMVRHKKTQLFRSEFEDDPFLSRVSVELKEVTEHSRPMTECSCFRKNFTRCELDLQLETPPLSTSEGELGVFLERVWRLAFAISTFLSNG